MKSRILVCGGRKYFNNEHITATLDYGMKHYFSPDFCIIEGGASGADTLARWWAKKNGVCCLNVDACWEAYGNAAGSIRNEWMLKFTTPDLVVAFPGGAGTDNMCNKAKARGIDIWRVAV